LQVCGAYLKRDNGNTALSARLVNHFATKLSESEDYDIDNGPGEEAEDAATKKARDFDDFKRSITGIVQEWCTASLGGNKMCNASPCLSLRAFDTNILPCIGDSIEASTKAADKNNAEAKTQAGPSQGPDDSMSGGAIAEAATQAGPNQGPDVDMSGEAMDHN